MAKKGVFTDEITALANALDALAGLDTEEQAFVYRTVGERLGLTPGNHSTNSIRDESSQGSERDAGNGDDGISPKDFLRTKKPGTEIERVTCLAYYLTHFRDTPTFKTNAITALNTEAAQPKMSNPSQTVGNAATQNHYLSAAGKGAKQITALGEDIVKALPDAEKIKATLAESGKPRRRRKTTKKPSQPKASRKTSRKR